MKAIKFAKGIARWADGKGYGESVGENIVIPLAKGKTRTMSLMKLLGEDGLSYYVSEGFSGKTEKKIQAMEDGHFWARLSVEQQSGAIRLYYRWKRKLKKSKRPSAK